MAGELRLHCFISAVSRQQATVSASRHCFSDMSRMFWGIWRVCFMLRVWRRLDNWLSLVTVICSTFVLYIGVQFLNNSDAFETSGSLVSSFVSVQSSVYFENVPCDCFTNTIYIRGRKGSCDPAVFECKLEFIGPLNMQPNRKRKILSWVSPHTLGNEVGLSARHANFFIQSGGREI